MKFTVMSQKQAEQTDGNKKYLISITDPYAKKPYLRHKWNGILHLSFDDLCPKECKSIGREDLLKTSKLFSEKDCSEILGFISRAHSNNIEEVVIHCRMGVSRSAAIGICLANNFGELTNSEAYIKENFRPNPYIMEVMNNFIKGLK